VIGGGEFWRGLTGRVASSGGGIRTPDTRIMIPGSESRKAKEGNGLRIVGRVSAHHLPTEPYDMPADLAEVVAAWATLDRATRAGVLAMIRSAMGKTEAPDELTNLTN
jgi:hypothetical protein